MLTQPPSGVRVHPLDKGEARRSHIILWSSQNIYPITFHPIYFLYSKGICVLNTFQLVLRSILQTEKMGSYKHLSDQLC